MQTIKNFYHVIVTFLMVALIAFIGNKANNAVNFPFITRYQVIIQRINPTADSCLCNFVTHYRTDTDLLPSTLVIPDSCHKYKLGDSLVFTKK
ncbi:MAG: hypothetical protein V4538_01695 [Bacteroidota bacterium]